MSAYFDQLCVAMTMLGKHNAIFMGQAVRFPGTAMYHTLKHLPEEQRIEMPVTEDMQMGAATGLALGGFLPVCIYPRFNFVLLATCQLVLHLDKLPIYSRGGYRPKVIIRTAVASPEPLDPGVQHLGDFTEPYRAMLSTVRVVRLYETDDIMPAYIDALEVDSSTMLVEYMARYQ